VIACRIMSSLRQPNETSSRSLPGATYDSEHSRDPVIRGSGRVTRARHFLLYRTRSDGQVEIARVIHDSMDLERHPPPAP